MEHKATCDCGQLSLTFKGDIKKTSICHCFSCQKRTGSAFGIQTKLERNQSEVQGKATLYERFGDDPADGPVTFHFCPTCGSTVFWELQGMAEFWIVAIGAFANPSLPAPTFSVYRARKHHWMTIPASVTTDWE
ncbi:MAG: GFA family protein [Bdellovibrionota bacterium]